MKIIIWDIETSHMEGKFWHPYQGYVNPKAITKDWDILCIAWKVLGKKQIKCTSMFDDGNKDSDYNVVKAFHEELQDTDIIIAHNGDKFDFKKFNSKVIEHGLPPLPKIMTLDTLKEVRKIGKFSYHRLDYLARKFGYEGKIPTTEDLWFDVEEGDEKAMRKMVKYCKQDVNVLEFVYERLKPYMKSHPNIADFGTMNCPKCNSSDTIVHKHRRMASGMLKRQYQCKSCGSYHTERYGILDKPLSKL